MTLARLIEAVEAGRWDHDAAAAWLWTKPGQIYGWAMEAFNGSLDAAKWLHDALLPGWGWETGINATFVSIAQVWKSGRDKAHAGTSETPARAWLLAILRAMEGRE